MFKTIFRIIRRKRRKTKQAKRKSRIEISYRKFARAYFEKRLAYFTAHYNLNFRKMRISGAKTRWGSCSVRKNINLNWRLMLAPPEVIDYVIAHELSHTVHMNHSKQFWAHVEAIIPDHRKYKKWLKENGTALTRRVYSLSQS